MHTSYTFVNLCIGGACEGTGETGKRWACHLLWTVYTLSVPSPPSSLHLRSQCSLRWILDETVATTNRRTASSLFPSPFTSASFPTPLRYVNERWRVMVGLEGTYLVPEDVVHLLPCHLCSLSIPCQIYTYNIVPLPTYPMFYLGAKWPRGIRCWPPLDLDETSKHGRQEPCTASNLDSIVLWWLLVL